MFWLVLYFLFIPVFAYQYDTKFPVGNYEVHFLFNNLTTEWDRIIFAYQNQEKLYFITVSNTSKTTQTICRQESQKRIVWGPIGCGDGETANCLITSEPIRQQRLSILNQVWWSSKTSNYCFLNGGDGDGRLCLGPFRLAIQGRDSLLPLTQSHPSFNKLLLQSQMVFVETLTDPLAMAPAIVQIPILPPALVVNTDCNPNWNQSFVPFNKDVYPTSISGNNEIWFTFQGTVQEGSRIVIRGSSAGATSFLIQFDSPLLTTFYQSYQQNFTFTGEFPSWIDLIKLDTPYTFLPGCSVQFSIDYTFQLAPINYPTAANYSWNISPRGTRQTLVCNYHIGRLTHNGEEYYPFTPEGGLGGGDLVFTEDELPIGVPANPLLDYQFNCNEFYPKNESFLDFGQNNVNGRSRRDRMSIPSQSCYSPFILPGQILLNINPDEKWIQCQKMGGNTAGYQPWGCSRPITSLLCKKNTYYFDQNCYYKFNPTTDQRFAVPLSKADESCKLWNPLSSSLVEMDIYLQAWLTNWFLFINPEIQDFYYRVPQFGSERCILLGKVILLDQSCYSIQLNNTYIFPICYIPSILNPPTYFDQQLSIQSASLRLRGQVGPPNRGELGKCRCFNSWTGLNCELKTCPTPTSLSVADPTTLTDELFFYQLCYNGERGQCYMTTPSICKCNYLYGPDASTLTSYPLLYQFKEFPCSCPSSSLIDTNQFLLNDQIYNIPFQVQSIPCGGVNRGACFISQNSTGRGECVCNKRYNILQSQFEDAFDGDICVCDRPIQPWLGLSANGLIQTSLCNNHGVCCGTGQTIKNPLSWDPYNLRCFDNGRPLTGCQCDNGWGGSSCTSPVPINLIYNRLVQRIQIQSQVFYYFDLGQRSLIRFVNATCQPYLSNQVGQNDTSICTFDNNLQLFNCTFNNDYYQFVYWQGDLDCVKSVTSDWFEYCGKNETINPFSGRFYQIASYRGAFKYLLEQPFTTSGYGSTNTACMCGPNNGGRLCAFDVSSYRKVDGKWSKMFCGENTLVPNSFTGLSSGTITSLNADLGRGILGDTECRCNAISTVDPSGRVGRTVNQFTGKGCACVVVENTETKEKQICGGHGRCIEPSFPYAYCATDIEDYLADSLSTPFVQSITDNPVTVIFTVLEDSYFYIVEEPNTIAPIPSTPTLFPTINPITLKPSKNPTPPTNNPTKNPTIKPTLNPSKSPTRKPTVNPTNKPTSNPTSKPTKNPSNIPSKSPTNKPSKNPTKNPT
jgi:PT repeat